MQPRQFDPDSSSPGLSLDSVREFFRIASTILGLAVILLGCISSMRLFGAVFSGVTHPEQSRRMVDNWAEVIGTEETTIRVGDQEYPLARPLALVVIGGGSVLLAWIALAMMLTGAKIVSWTAGDADAVKRLLRHAFGRWETPDHQPK